jgi:prepilin-type N-terminal cleavage/methylation domain-containing protein
MRYQAPLQSPKRHGFTIVELLVALALVLFIMSIISQVFVDSSEAFRNQRAKAELSEKLRFLTQTLRADLRSNHFEAGRKLSDSDFWADGPPQVGYFRLEQTNLPLPVTNLSGSETLYTFPNPNIAPNQVQSQLLAFTSFLGGKDPRGFHSTSMPSPAFDLFNQWKGANLSPGDTRYEESVDTYQSPDAEVAWFLGPTGDYQEFLLQDEPSNADGTPQSVKLYKLYRRVWLMLPQELSAGADTSNLNTIGPALANRVSVVPPGLPNLNPPIQLNGDNALQKPNSDVPMRRGIGNFFAPAGGQGSVANWRQPCFDITQGKDSTALIADNVLSFSVEVCPEGSTQFVPLATALGIAGPAVFDSWTNRSINPAQGITGDFSGWNVPNSPGVIPMPLIPDPNALGAPLFPKRLVAIRVTIRLFDTNNALSPSKTTWQATVVEPL